MGNRSLLWMGMSALALSACTARQAEQQLPNIIYVFPDQMRNHAMEFWGDEDFRSYVNFRNDPVHTPHLNAFARQSLVLSSAMSNCPISSPHRGSLLSGMYPHKSGIPVNCRNTSPYSSLRDDIDCIGDVFNAAGYECAYIGKYHANVPTKNDPQHPGQYVQVEEGEVWDAYTPPAKRHGFSYWYSYGTFNQHKNPHYWDNEGRRHEPHEWSPLHEAKKVIAYLKNEGNVRDVEKPFFMMVGMNPPHSPYRSLNDCMEEDFNLYKDIPLDSLLVRPNVDWKMDKVHSAPYYFASVTGIDRAFGMILDALKELKMEDNTIVVFSSDHGETMCSQGAWDPKNSPYAESMNVPFMVRYPHHIAHRVDNLLLSSPDIMPTLLGLAGLSDRIPSGVQGKNYADLFFDEKSAVTRPEGALYIRNVEGGYDDRGISHAFIPEARGLKTGRYTLALYIDWETKALVNTCLYDDRNDPYQMKNLPIHEHMDIVKPLCKEMGRILTEIDDPWAKEHILNELIEY